MSEFNVTYEFQDGERTITASPEETILNAAHRQGLKIIAECELGLCGTCKATRIDGEIAVDEEEPAGLSSLDLRNGAILACQSYARSDVHLKVAYKLGMIQKSQEFCFEAPIVALGRVADSVVRIEVDGAGAPDFAFLPGQYANVLVPCTETERSYSFSSAPQHTGRLAFLIRMLPQGVMSDWLRNKAAIGQSLQIRGPYGSFFLRDGSAPLLFVAGGTGLGPFLSMLGHLVATGQTGRHVRLLYGVNDRLTELSSIDALDEFKSKLPNFDYSVAVAAPDPEWRGEKGFVTALLKEEYLAGGDAEAYLCGPPPMVEAGGSWLSAHGLSQERIYFERFTAS